MIRSFLIDSYEFRQGEHLSEDPVGTIFTTTESKALNIPTDLWTKRRAQSKRKKKFPQMTVTPFSSPSLCTHHDEKEWKSEIINREWLKWVFFSSSFSTSSWSLMSFSLFFLKFLINSRTKTTMTEELDNENKQMNWLIQSSMFNDIHGSSTLSIRIIESMNDVWIRFVFVHVSLSHIVEVISHI